MFPCRERADANGAAEVVLSADGGPPEVFSLIERRIIFPCKTSPDDDPADEPVIEVLVQFHSRRLGAAPCEREREAAIGASEVRERQLDAVRQAVLIFGVEERQKEQSWPVALDDSRWMVRVAGHLDSYRSLIDHND